MKNELAKRENPWTDAQIKLITSTVAVGATPDELKLFLYTASRTGLDPLTKQIHFVKRAGRMTVQTGIDGYRAIAERSGTLAGIDDAVYDREDAAHPNKASVTVWRLIDGIRVSFTASARWNEYAVVDGFIWKKMPYLMLAKCAEALALRKAFPNDLSGLYTNEEMQQADKPDVEPAPARRVVAAIGHVDTHDIDMAQAAEEIAEYDRNHPEPEPVYVQDSVQDMAAALGGTVVEDNDIPKKQCPFCKKWHTGKYPKCIECWKAGVNTKTKKIINPDAEPFPS